MRKTYVHNQVTYGSLGQKWTFKAGIFEYRTGLPGGKETADKVARVVSGSLARTRGAGLDNLGRANILTIVEKAKAVIWERQG